MDAVKQTRGRGHTSPRLIGRAFVGLATTLAVFAAQGFVGGLGNTAYAAAASPRAAAPPVLDPGDDPRDGAWIVLTRTSRDRDALLADTAAAPTYTYRSAVKGFAADLDAASVQRLAADERVVRLEPVRLQRLAGVGPSRLSAAARGDLPGLDLAFSNVGGVSRAGAGTVVGFVDSGLWPENPVFAPQPAQSGANARFGGACDTAATWPASTCNDKIVAARWFVDGFGTEGLSSVEEVSARDVVGHGTEVAALAVGADVQARDSGVSLGRVSGTAPAASAAIYKACWTAPDPELDGCATSDVVAALDAAVRDEVDVVVYGASGTRAGDAVSRALLGVRDAGIVPVTPAGNDGALEAPMPWGLTVGASRTLTRPGSVALLGGSRLQGTMVAEGVSRAAPLVAAEAVRAVDARPAAARLCRPGALDPVLTAGAIVVCERGGNPRVEKSAAVAQADGVGMVLVNVPGGSTDAPADLHAVPTVHLGLAEATRLQRLLAERGRLRARLDPLSSAPAAAPVLADFSARTSATGLLGASVLAPGVDLLTATSPATGGTSWGFVSGTSYAAARVAGTVALLLADRPGRSADEAVSSLVSTAYQVLGDPSPLAQGNGLLDPSRVLNPGLAVSAQNAGFDAWLQGLRPARRIQTPSLVMGDVTRPTRVVRTLRNVSGRSATWRFTATGVSGYRITARPGTVRLAPGARVDVRLRVVPAPGSVTFSTGRLEWQSARTPGVRLPLALRSSRLRQVRARPPQTAATVTTAGPGSSPARATTLLPR